MTGRTSSQQAREEEQQLAANDLFAVGFGDAGNVVAVEEELEPQQIEAVEEIEDESEPDDNVMAAMLNAASVVGTSMPEPEEAPEPVFAASPYGVQTPSEPSGLPGGPPQQDPPGGLQSPSQTETSSAPSGPPGGPPQQDPPGGLQSPPPTGTPSEPSGLPGGPPQQDPPGGLQSPSQTETSSAPSGPPGGPPHQGPPGGPPHQGPPGGPPAASPPTETPSSPSGPPGGPPHQGPPGGPPAAPPPTEVIEQQLPSFESPQEDKSPEPTRETNDIVSEALDLISSSSNKIQNLEHEINRLRAALSGSAEVISEIEEQPMPPVVGPDYVVPSHMVADFVRIGRQLHKEGLVHADVGAVAILNPDEAGLMHSSTKGATLGQMTEQHIASGRLGQTAPGNAPEQWRMLEVLIALKSLQTKGPAACIHTHPPFATAISCEKDLIVLKPIDEEGINHLGNIVIVDPDADNPDEYLRHLAEALKQGNMKAVVVRGHGVFSTGVNFDEAWRWASVIEHSMRVLMHARQANLQV